MTESFPTGKPHISFSEWKAWKECPFRHKLAYIDKIDTFQPSPFLDFGTAVHEGAESFLNEGTVPREKHTLSKSCMLCAHVGPCAKQPFTCSWGV